jgi:hypothetical protein
MCALLDRLLREVYVAWIAANTSCVITTRSLWSRFTTSRFQADILWKIHSLLPLAVSAGVAHRHMFIQRFIICKLIVRELHPPTSILTRATFDVLTRTDEVIEALPHVRSWPKADIRTLALRTR